MAVLQAYQADLLKELDGSDKVSKDKILELRRTADLSLRTTKETARTIGRSMAAMEINTLTLPVFQGAVISSEPLPQSLPPGNAAELGISPPLRGSLEQLVWLVPAGAPFQDTKLVVQRNPEASLERLVTLVDYLAAWKLLPNVSAWVLYTVERGYRIQFRSGHGWPSCPWSVDRSPSHVAHQLPNVSAWVLHTVERGYRIQFSAPPPPFSGVFPTLVGLEQGPGNGTGIRHSFEEGGHRGGPSSQQGVRVLQPVLHCSKDGWGPASHFRSEAAEPLSLAAEVQNAEKFLRFAFRGEAYQYQVLPFSLALFPRTFTKCVDAALAPLQLQGIHILNYIDDWLILAQSEQLVRTTYLGMVWDSTTMQARLSPARIESILTTVARVREGQSLTVKQFQQLLGPGVGSSLLPRHASDGHIPYRLRSGHGWPSCPWSVDRSPSHVAHQLPRDVRCVSGSETLSPGPNRPSLTTQETPLSESSSYFWASQFGSRHPVEAGAEARGMEAKASSLRHSPNRSVLAGPSMVLGLDFPSRRLSMGDSHLHGSPLSGGGHHRAPSPGAVEVVGVAPVETILQSRAPSTRKLYTLKWILFTSWCGHRQQDPVNCPVGTVLEFLQERFYTGLAHSILKVYVAAISAYHAPSGWRISGCPVRVLDTYIHRAALWRKTDQLFVCYGPPKRGLLASKQPLSRWIVDAISRAYDSSGLPSPLGVKAHFTRGMAASKAFMPGVPIQDICNTVGWSTPLTFVRFYDLDLRVSPGSSTQLEFLKGNVSGYVCNPGSPKGTRRCVSGHTSCIPPEPKPRYRVCSPLSTELTAGVILSRRPSKKQLQHNFVRPHMGGNLCHRFHRSLAAPRATSRIRLIWQPAKQRVSEWVQNTVSSGYTLQFAHRPPRFSSVKMSENTECGLYSHYFLVTH
ncbi:Gag-Pro-Pol polyprotein [Labeo rohita]|uniref:Gag-Pro-Pol polyprotein n=1 Tax=Labeo rohita TaxID=84645 RepID=A0ABQ8L5Y6_LABRO|nr:Gag-Pro-Pol polyprotein [Labeo rohita]